MERRWCLENDPDVVLMLHFQKGDVDAFQELFRKYTPGVVNFAFRFLGSRALAEEVAQEVFLQVYRWQHRYIPRAKFTTWLFKIVRNRCLNITRESEYHIRQDDDALLYDIPDVHSMKLPKSSRYQG